MKSKGSTACGMSMSAQKSSLRSAPKSTGKHKNPKVKPIGSKSMTGGKTK